MGVTNSAEQLHYLVPPSRFQFKKFQGSKFYFVHHVSAYSVRFKRYFLSFTKFLHVKWEDLISLGEPILQNVWFILFPLLQFNFKNIKDLNFLSFITFQCILDDSAALFSVFLKFSQIKSGWPNFLGRGPILQSNWII